MGAAVHADDVCQPSPLGEQDQAEKCAVFGNFGGYGPRQQHVYLASI